MKVKEFVEQHKGETCVIKVYSNATIFTKHIEMKDNKAYWVNLKEKHIARLISKEYYKEVLSVEEEETEAIDPITGKTSKIKVYNLQVKRLTNRNKRFTISLGKEYVEAKGKFSLWKKDMQEQNP